MALYLIRTAVAVRREHWDGAPADRPLTPEGRAQAVAIARWLSPVQVSHILSSPRPRCVQTVTPLADQSQPRARWIRSPGALLSALRAQAPECGARYRLDGEKDIAKDVSLDTSDFLLSGENSRSYR